MRHNDPRLTANTYADASLFSLRGAVGKLPWNDAGNDAQRSDFGGLLPSLAVTVDGVSESENSPMNTGLKSLSFTVCHAAAKSDEWCAIQGSNL